LAVKKIASLVGRGKSKSEFSPALEPDEPENQPVTVNRTARLMQEMGYRGKVVIGDDWCWVDSATNGNRFNIYLYSDQRADPESNARSMQFDGGWGGLSPYDARRYLTICNRFNHDWRYARATVATDQDSYALSVKLDHYCPDGLTDQAFFAAADMYIQLFEDMAKRIAAFGDEALSVVVQRHHSATALMWGADNDPEQAVGLYLENARAGFGGSMSSLGDFYEQGSEATQSSPVATYFFAQAAERGQPSAYFGLARALAQGSPDEAIMIEAAKYALLASRDLPDGQTRHRAQMLRDELMEKLGDDAQEAAVRLAGVWAPLTYEGATVEATPMHDTAQMPPSSALN